MTLLSPSALEATYRQVNNVSQLPKDDPLRDGLILSASTVIERMARDLEITEQTRAALLQILYATSTFVGE